MALAWSQWDRVSDSVSVIVVSRDDLFSNSFFGNDVRKSQNINGSCERLDICEKNLGARFCPHTRKN